MNLHNQHTTIIATFRYLLLGLLLVGLTKCVCSNQIASNIQPVEMEPIPTEVGGPGGGITNLGATCYMNSTLQALVAFYETTILDLDDTKGPLVAPLKKVIQAMKVEKRTATSEEARMVFEALGRQFAWTTSEGKQCDASELLHLILDWVEVPLFSTENTFVQQGLGVQPTPILSNVEGACMHYVALPNSEKTGSMQQLFDESLQPELLDGYMEDGNTPMDNVYKCKRLSPHVDAEILPLQLSRFATKGGRVKLADGSYKEEKLERFKLQDRVTAPMNLKISSKQTTDSQERHYTLAGFIWHSGSIDSGHYKAYIKQEGRWVCYNDSAVTQISEAEAEARAQEAYVFFYQSNQPAGGS